MNETKAARYQRLQRRTGVAGIAAGGVLLALLAATPAGSGLASFARKAGAGLPAPFSALAPLVLFVFCAVALWEIVALPAVLYRELTLDRRYSRGGSTLDRVLPAQIQASVVGVVGALVAALATQVSVGVAGRGWWLLDGTLLALCLAGAVRVAPAVLVRFGAARPIARPDLSRRLTALAARAGVSVAGLDEWHTGDGSVSAMVAGVGSARRIFVASEMLRDWSDDEVAVVVAHELAHHAHRDLWQTIALDSAVLVAACGTANAAWSTLRASFAPAAVGDLETLPFLALVAGLVWLVATPVRHAQSRQQERRADAFALTLTGGADAFGAAVRRLGASRLVEDQPSRLAHWFFSRHPSVAERLAFAEDFARQRRQS